MKIYGLGPPRAQGADRIDQLIGELADLLGTSVEKLTVKVNPPEPIITPMTEWALNQSDESIAKFLNDDDHSGKIDDLVDISHGVAIVRKWHFDAETGRIKGKVDIPMCMALIHSEISEALEGDRKNLIDAHIPPFTAVEAELADALHRIFDLSGRLGLRLGDAWVAKALFNLKRSDWDKRSEPGGKRY